MNKRPMTGTLTWAFTMIKVFLWLPQLTKVAKLKYLCSLIFYNLALPLTDGGDMDARDYVRMRYEKRLRDGLEDRSGHSQSIGSFERFTKVKKETFHKPLIFCTISWTSKFLILFYFFRALVAVWWKSRAGRMVKGWDTVRLGFQKLLRTRASILNAKEALGMYDKKNRKEKKTEWTKHDCLLISDKLTVLFRVLLMLLCFFSTGIMERNWSYIL